MKLPTTFSEFLTRIRLTDDQRDDCKTGHKTLRKRLKEDATLSPLIVNTFLQGSYRRATAIKPAAGKRSDVDVIVVTKLHQDDYPDPEDAIKIFLPFMEKHYKGKYEIQGRSIGIELSYIDMDLVITSAPSESELGIFESNKIASDDTLEDIEPMIFKAEDTAEWKSSPLYIPDRDAKEWTPTHPLRQIEWTQEKNGNCNGFYVNIVKAIKWWRRINFDTPEYPKGYPVEHLVGVCCPDNIQSIAEGITLTLENIVTTFASDAAQQTTPFLPDHGVPEHNVFKRVSGEDFTEFYEQTRLAAVTARKALNSETLTESINYWKELFGDEFAPDTNKSGFSGGFTPPSRPASPPGGRFA